MEIFDSNESKCRLRIKKDGKYKTVYEIENCGYKM
jgi:hypothetical protein